MERIQMIEHNGVEILLEDFSNMKPDQEMDDQLAIAGEKIRSREPGTVRTLLDITDSRYNREYVSKFQDFAAGNKEYVCAGAIVGMSSLLAICVTTISKATGRSFRAFPDRETAKEWLSIQ